MQNGIKIFLKKIFVVVLVLFLMVFGTIVFLLWNDTRAPYNVSVEDVDIPHFKKIVLDDGHMFDSETSLPMRASTFIDINNDGVDEIFLGGGAGQDDQFFQFQNGVFVDVSDTYSIKKGFTENSLAASSHDLDNNGFQDLIVSRDNSLNIYYNDGDTLLGEVIETGLNNKTSPLGLTFGDINKDGFSDIFVAGYIKREQMNGLTNFAPGYGGRSELLLNNSDGSFTNITKSAGFDYIHNTFQGIFIDLNNDTWLDLVVAHDTGEPRIYKNNGDLTFQLQKNPYTDKFAYPMGIAIGDYDNDNDPDIFFSNIGSTLPKTMVKGDLESTKDLELGWFLLQNNGNFNFQDLAKSTLIQDYEFSWGAVFSDMNNDGLQDLLVAENYVDLAFHKLFPLPGRFLLQNTKGTFSPVGKRAGTTNKNFGITPLVSDFNSDGRNDIVWVNIAGPSFAFIQESGINNNYIQLQFPDAAKYLGAHVELTRDGIIIASDDFISGEGLAADQSNTLHFGLGDATKLDMMLVYLLNGTRIQIDKPQINMRLNIADYD